MNTPKKTSIATAVSAFDGARRARDIFHNNSDTLVAGFLVRNPDVDPATIQLVFTPQPDGVIRFSIEPRELFVPDARAVPSRESFDDDNEDRDDLEFTKEDYFTAGWNSCRAEMIRLIQMKRAPDAMVSALDLGADPLQDAVR